MSAQQPQPTRGSRWLIRGLVLALLISVPLLVLGSLARSRSASARQACCASDLKMIATCIRMYAQDYDDLLPPGRPLQDLVATQWGTFPIKVRGRTVHHICVETPGPLWDYAKNACLFCCPSDPANRLEHRFPDPGLSYRWNRALGCRPLPETANQQTTRLLWERDFWHHGGMNVGYVDGYVQWEPRGQAPQP